MCCGQRIVQNQQESRATPAASWVVYDAAGNVAATKTSEISAKLAAARIGGTWERTQE